MAITNDYREQGLLVLRVGIGLLFMYFGWPKIIGGEETWAKVGSMAMTPIGIHFALPFWGFMAAIAEFGGGLLLTLGLFTRLACGLLTFTMIMATVFKFSTGGGLAGASQPLSMGIVFFSLLFIGPGRYSFDAWLGAKSAHSWGRGR
ncbi:MAG: DoxX family protein [Negativicutes bacterium]|nr:DoxX family protein [Negativicutes bacterium]MDR3592812.1 DoxX family protein [Negativicutes bacterium]